MVFEADHGGQVEVSDKPQLLQFVPAEIYGAAGAGLTGFVAWLVAKLYNFAIERQLAELKAEVSEIKKHIEKMGLDGAEHKAIAQEQAKMLDRILDRLDK